MHGYNALKYLTAVVAVIIRTAYELKKGKVWLVMALISSAMAVLYNTYWDIVVDWGLLRRNSKNFLLRDKIMVSHKSVYYTAMVISCNLRDLISCFSVLLSLMNLVLTRLIFAGHQCSSESCLVATSSGVQCHWSAEDSYFNHNFLSGDSSTWHLELL